MAGAREVGGRLARAGAVVLTGGLGGVMAAAAAGAADNGGPVIGLLPGADRRDGHADGLLLPTGLGELRNGLLVRCADGVVAVGGSWGTLSEIALAVRTGVPVVCLGSWSIRAGGVDVSPPRAATPAEAVELLLAALP